VHPNREYDGVVPANRQHLPRSQREDEIIDVASRLFIERGFTETSMSAIARELGLAINAVAWYFPDRDDILAAAVQRPVDEAITMLGLSVGSPELWMKECINLDAFEGLTAVFSATHSRRQLLPLIYTRAVRSRQVALFLERHNTLLKAFVHALLEQSGVGKGQRRNAEFIGHQVLVAMMIGRITSEGGTVGDHLYYFLEPVITLAGGEPPVRRKRSKKR
jgi:AcrR family transcriptional regulator